MTSRSSGKGTRLYSTWCNMKTRCYNENNHSFATYGGRGILICDEWKNNFAEFRRWSEENGYAEDLSIDRIDNRLGYTPDNCRWATDVEQSRNRDYAWKVTIDGVTKYAVEWCEHFGVKPKTAHTRKSRGWNHEAAVSAPWRSRYEDYN